MTARISLLVFGLTPFACGQAIPAVNPGNSTTAIDPGVDTTAMVRVFQEQRSCCYDEGQLSYLSVDGVEHEISLGRIGLVPLIELEVPAGEIEVESWQRPCSGNCGHLDQPVNQCSIDVEAGAAETIRLLVSFEPGPDPCEFTVLDEDPAVSVPLGFGFRAPLPSCVRTSPCRWPCSEKPTSRAGSGDAS